MYAKQSFVDSEDYICRFCKVDIKSLHSQFVMSKKIFIPIFTINVTCNGQKPFGSVFLYH